MECDKHPSMDGFLKRLWKKISKQKLGSSEYQIGLTAQKPTVARRRKISVLKPIYIYIYYMTYIDVVYIDILRNACMIVVACFFWGRCTRAWLPMSQCAPLLQWLRGMPKQVKVCVLDGPPSRPPRTRITSRKKLRKNCAGSDGVCG